MGKLRLQRTYGAGFPTDQYKLTPELVAEQWSSVVDFSRVTHPSTTQESFEPMMRNALSPPVLVRTSRLQECIDILNRVREALKSQPDSFANHIHGVFQLHINKNVWTISLLHNNINVYDGTQSQLSPDLIIYIEEEDFLDLACGRLRPQQVQ